MEKGEEDSDAPRCRLNANFQDGSKILKLFEDWNPDADIRIPDKAMKLKNIHTED